MEKQEVELVGREVSCRVLGVLFAALAKRGLPAESLTEGVDYPLEYLLDKHRRIDWASFHKIMTNAGRIWSDEELIELGHAMTRSAVLRPLRLISGMFFSVKEIYFRMIDSQKGSINLAYTCMQNMIHEAGPGHLVLERTVEPGYLPVREYFVLLKGVLTAIPTARGLEVAVVDMEEIEGGARYQIWLPEEKRLLVWLRRTVMWPFTMRAVVQELREALAALQQQYATLEDEMARREQAEAQLRYQADLLAHINDAVVATDAAFRVTAWNRAAERMFGWTAEEVLGRALSEMVRLDITDAARNKARRLLTESGRYNTERIAYHRNGGAVYIESIMITLYDEAGEIRGYVGVNRDITERKQAEESLRESEARYRSLIEQMPGVMYQAALDDVGTTIYINPQIEQITGYPPQVWTDQPGFFAEVIHPDDRERVLAAANEMQVRDEPLKVEYRLLARDGREVWFQDEARVVRDGAGRPVCIQGVMLDVTARKEVEEAFLARTQQYLTLLDVAPISIFRTDATGNNRYVNQRYTEITGLSRIEALGEGWQQMIPPEAHDRIIKGWYEAVQAGRLFEAEYPIRRPDGSTAWLFLRAAPERDANGAVSGYVGAGIDITERRRAEEALSERERQYQTLVELVPVGIYRTDATWQNIYVNQRYTEITGLTAEQIRDQRWPQFIVPDDREMVMTSWSQAIEQGLPFEIEASVRRPDGAVIWVITRGISEYNERGELTGYVGIIVDLTERKQAEKALAESQRHFQALFDHALDAILLFDDDIDFVDVNPATCALLGYSREELVQMNVSDLTPQAKQGQIEPLRQKFLTAAQLSGEYTLLAKDGAVIDLEYRATANVIPGLHMAVLRDITERKRLEEEIRESRNQLRSILDTVPDYVVMVERDGTIIFANRPHPSLTMADIIGTNYIDWTPEASRQVFRAMLERAIETEEPQAFETWGQGLEGTQKWYLHRVRPVKEEDEVVALTIVSTDITERKQAEEALRQSEARLRVALTQAPLIVFNQDLDLRYTWVSNPNPPSQADAFIGGTDADFLQADEAARLTEIKQSVLETGSGRREEVKLTIEGQSFYYDLTVEPLRDPTNNVVGIIGAAFDITKRKEAEQAVRESEQRYRNLFENSPVSIWEEDFAEVKAYLEGLNFREIADFEGYLEDHPEVVTACLKRVKIVDVNQATLELMRAGEKSEVTMSLYQTATEEKPQTFKQELLAIYRGQSQLEFETETLRLDGVRRNIVVRWLVPPGHEEALSRVLVSVVDITEPKQAAEALARREREYRSLAENLPDIIARFDHNLRHVYVNRRIEAVTGLPVQAFLGKNHTELNMPASLAKYWAENIQAVLDSGQPQIIEYTFEGVNGPVNFESRIIPEFGPEGQVESALGINRDVTEQKQAEQEREALITELEAKNAELERFTYTVSHDLKSPLITIKGFLGHLERDALADNRKRLEADIKYIREATETMGQLLDDLLELSRIGRIVNPSQMVSLSELADEAIMLLAGQIEARQVQIEVSPELPVVWGDRPRLLEVLQNLIDNAIKYTDNQAKPRIEIGTRQTGEEHICYVRDNGIGIEPRYQNTIFKLFERLDSNGEGTGIGLALVKRIIELHGGRIWVESEGQGQGSMFCFTLPGGEAIST